jgi:hypothetical protein
MKSGGTGRTPLLWRLFLLPVFQPFDKPSENRVLKLDLFTSELVLRNPFSQALIYSRSIEEPGSQWSWTYGNGFSGRGKEKIGEITHRGLSKVSAKARG